MFLFREVRTYRDWTTAQLQQRRLDLYNMVPQSQHRNGVAEVHLPRDAATPAR